MHVTTYGVRRSRASTSTTSGTGKENESANKPPNKVNTNKKMINNYTSQTGIFVYSTSVVQMPCWHKTEGRKDVSFGETKYFKQRPLKGKCLWLQGTQKVECQAHVEVKLFTLYPGFAASKDEKEGLSMRRLWYLQEEQITSLKTELAKGQPVSTLTRPIRRSPFRASNTHTHTHTQFTYERYNSTYSLYPLSYIHRRLSQH